MLQVHCLSRIFTQHGSVNLLWDIWQCIVSALHCLHSFFSWHLLWLVWRHQRILVLAFRMGLYLNILDCHNHVIERMWFLLYWTGNAEDGDSWYLHVNLHCVTTQKNNIIIIFTTMRISSLTQFFCYCVWYFIGTRIRSDCHVKFFYNFFQKHLCKF